MPRPVAGYDLWVVSPEAPVSEAEQDRRSIAEPEPGPPGQQRWMLGAVVAALLGLLLYLAIQYTGPSTVSDERLEAEALEAVEAGRALEAAEHYAELASRAMDSRERAQWLLEQASAYEQAEEGAQAVSVLREASQLDIGEEDLQKRIVLRLGGLLAATGEHQGAHDIYAEIVASPESSPEYLALALLGMSDALIDLGDPQGAQAAVSEALGRYPDHPEVALATGRRLAEILTARDRGREALVVLEALPGQDWEPLEQASWLLARARIHDRVQDFDAALTLYDQALQVVGEEGEVAAITRFEVAALRFRRGDLEPARQQLEALDVEGLPHELRGHVKLELAEVLRHQGHAERSQALYREVIDGWDSLEDLVATAREGLGALLVSSLDGDAALEDFFTALAAGGDDAQAAADVLLGHGNGQLSRGESEPALATFERIRGSVDDGSHWATAADHGRAAALAQLDRNHDALELLRELRSQCEPEQRLVIDAQIADTMLRSGQLEQAQAAFESLLEVSEATGFDSSAAKLGLAGVARAHEHYEEAIGLYQQVATSPQASEQQVDALQGMANLYLELERDEESMAAYRQLVELLDTDSPALSTIRMSMAEIYARRGDIERERALWQGLMAEGLGPRELARARIRLVELDMATASELADTAGLEAALAALVALRSDPDIPDDHQPDVVFGQVVCLFELGRYEQAVTVIEGAIGEDQAGPDPDVFLTLKEQAQAALRGEPLDPDLEGMPAPGSGPSDEEWEALLARVGAACQLRDAGEYEAAMNQFVDLLGVVEDLPTLASIQRELASTQAAMGDLEAARATLKASIADYGELEEAVFAATLALAELDLRESDPASALLRLRGLEPPDEGHALWKLELQARAHSTAGDTEAALSTWREAIELAQSDPAGSVVAWTGLGDLYIQMGEPDRALDAFQRAAVLAPDGPPRDQARLRAAMVALEGGDLVEADQTLQDLEADATDPESRLQVALARSALHQEGGDWQAALEAVKALSLDAVGPDYQAQIVDARCVAMLALGQVDEARAAYQDLARRWPEHPEVDAVTTFGLAEVDAAAGRIDAAAERYRGLVARSSDRFRQGQALLRLAQLFENHGQQDDARAVYTRVRDEYEDEPELAATAAGALE